METVNMCCCHASDETKNYVILAKLVEDVGQ